MRARAFPLLFSCPARVITITRPLCALASPSIIKHMAVRIYRPSSNQSAALKASLRSARPMGAAGEDQCLPPCELRASAAGHVTLEKRNANMDPWQGRDASVRRR